VSLRILFADDSVTAQNMGKKILTEAGYEVVAVSNGAAAVKKIAEHKPDIIILDVYMPGYTGLEVCEKVRSSAATIKTPVLLTVGKMEPYKPEDASRVRADGVIIKPFEASDLLAIVKKFEDRISETAAAAAATTAVLVAMPEVAIAPEPTIEAPEPSVPSKMHFTLDVPDHMATASAFSDLLGSEPGHVQENFMASAPTAVAEVKAPVEIAKAAAAPDYEIPISWKPEPEPQASAAVEVSQSEPVRPPQIPVYRDPDPPQVETFSATTGSVGDVEIPQEPTLQSSDAEATRNTIAEMREPDLVTTDQESPVANEEPAPTVEAVPVKAAEMREPESEPVAAPAPDMDFEARVAAAMAAYSQAPEAVAHAVPVPQQPAVVEEPLPSAPVEIAESVPAPAPPPSVAYEAPAEQFAPAPEVTAHAMEAAVAVPEPQQSQPGVRSHSEPELSTSHNAVAATIENALPMAAAAAAAETGAEHHTIAQAVHRVMERIKGDLVEEIVRELRASK
jgi:CheY-like chemotaxis protein